MNACFNAVLSKTLAYFVMAVSYERKMLVKLTPGANPMHIFGINVLRLFIS
jgi:hypothetical protein